MLETSLAHYGDKSNSNHAHQISYRMEILCPSPLGAFATPHYFLFKVVWVFFFLWVPILIYGPGFRILLTGSDSRNKSYQTGKRIWLRLSRNTECVMCIQWIQDPDQTFAKTRIPILLPKQNDPDPTNKKTTPIQQYFYRVSSRLWRPVESMRGGADREEQEDKAVNFHLSTIIGNISEIQGHTSEILFHISEILGHISEILVHITKILGHIPEIIVHITEILGHISEILWHISEILGHLS